MGCDIHMVVERQIAGKWVAWRILQNQRNDKGDFCLHPALDRNYKRFAALANVRGDGPDPRGLPDDVSETTKALVEDLGEDGHSHSWLPIEAMATALRESERMKLDDFASKYPVSWYFSLEEERGPFRVVFWFDN